MFDILVIEDDKKIRQELCVLLKNNKYNAYGTDDFENVLELIKNKIPNIILLDINLPSTDGVKKTDICRKVENFIIKCRIMSLILIFGRILTLQ